MKEWIANINQKIDELSKTTWMKYFRITSSVVWNLVLIFILFVSMGFVFVGSIGAGYFASLVKDEPLRPKTEMRNTIFNYEETSTLYFASNKYLGKMRTDLERQETTLKKVSPNVINAVLATEDEYFYQHNGIVPKAVVRGILQDVSNSNTQTGGSTLTQQLIKNQVLTNEVSYERKAKELLLAMRLEHFMTKDEILEAYLNVIPYGRNASGRNIAGVETAAEGLFNKSAKDLNLAQSSYIAGIPQSPYAYTPFTQSGKLKDADNLKLGINRMKTVLYRMHETGYITEKQYKKALKYNIKKDFRKPEVRPEEKYPYVTYEIENRAKEIMAKILAKKDGIDVDRLSHEAKLKEKYKILADRELRSKGYKIYSTIDKKMYDTMQKVKDNFPYYGATFTKQVTDSETGKVTNVPDPVQVGSIVIENKTGKILSFVGGRDHKLEATNHATQAKRSNGSTMKPLLVYAPAIQYGVIGAGSPVADVKFSINGWSPSNYTETDERGLISAREALKDSQNLPAIRLYAQIINHRPAGLLRRNGFTSLDDSDYTNYATSIGALRNGVTIEENTNAYATFANGGKFVDAYMISKIVDSNGKTVYKHKVKSKTVYSKQTSYITTDMLRDVLKQGTGTTANSNLKFRADFAAKTGTSQEYKDVWLVGYNPDISLGVWMGYDQPKTLYQANGVYGQPSTRINLLWARLMNAVYDTNPKLATANGKTFTQPAGVVSQTFCGITGNVLTNACSGNARTDLFNANVMLPGAETAFSGGVLSNAFKQKMLSPFGGDYSKLFGAKEKEEKEKKEKEKEKEKQKEKDRTNSTNSNNSSNSNRPGNSNNSNNSNQSNNNAGNSNNNSGNNNSNGSNNSNGDGNSNGSGNSNNSGGTGSNGGNNSENPKNEEDGQ
ncbi:penicillin-binding protein [Rummeliibacillus sp. TYF005]|uniref:transglycosylase domain-containing protein n=1 Tax=Rummeliibacillus sp. TYF005 TaxID=2058214 RepID=UPI000F529B88|nr:transglycosylase domain-containing protein [Rummeliibacillus sp. TYF005]RPJ95848.1 penicillin-binding protein [Rummeliibacillus sp. TYF005]